MKEWNIFNIQRFVSGLLFLFFLMISPVIHGFADDSGMEIPTSYLPSFPLDENITWIHHLNMSGGYPLVPHEFGPFTQEDWIALDEDQDQTVTILHYYNPPAFPNETVYGFFHHELGFVLWIKELYDTGTGITSLAQIGESGKDMYNPEASPAENDYYGNIEWFFVDDKLYPRTWIKGNMSDGMRWTEYWGPFDRDEKGSVLRERNYSVHTMPITVQNKEYNGFAVTMIGERRR